MGLGEVCSASSSLLYSSPAQALHCYLQGVELVRGGVGCWGGGQCGDVYIHILSLSLSLSLFLSQPDGEEEWPDDVVSQFSELVRYPTEVKAIVDKVEAGGTWFSVTLYVMYVSREQW